MTGDNWTVAASDHKEDPKRTVPASGEAAMRQQAGPLSGFRIVDLSSILMGPFATQILGEYGADIIKVESPEGDLMRLGGAMRNPKMGSLFLQANYNKRSIVLDLKTEAGREVLLKLCRSADAFIHNIRSAAISRLGLGYDDVRRVNDAIVYVSLTGYGEKGPYAGKPAYDDLIQGMSSIPSLFTHGGQGEPRFVPLTMADRIVGLNAAHATLAALIYRERTGQGQSIEVPMFETMTQFVLGDHLGGLSFVPPSGPPGYNRLLSPHRRPYKTLDGYLCVLVYTDKQWESFFKALGRLDDFYSNPLYSDHATRTQNYDRVYADLAARLETRTTDEWTKLLTAHDIPCVPALEIGDLIENEHITAVGLVQETDHPSEGKIRFAGPPASWSKTCPGVYRHAPRLGENTRSILLEAGYTGEEIEELLASGSAKEAQPNGQEPIDSEAR
jgi:crotonobetainyl-CoA:carnitine CoA-transferase CaiB-like acyl-CoA transferase